MKLLHSFIVFSIFYGCMGDLSKLDGDQIVTLMQTFGEDKCPAPADNQGWAPIPDSISCGDKARCDFPKQWCAYKPAADGTPDLQTLTCIKLKDECTKAFEEADKSGALVPPPQGGTTASSESPQESTTAASETPQSPEISPVTETVAAPTEVDTTTVAETTAESSTTAAPDTTAAPETAATSTATSPAAAPATATQGGVGTIPPFGECCDYHEYCCFWASLGQCETNKLFMVQLCQSSCGTCGCTKAALNDCVITVAANCASGNVTSTEVCPCKATDLINRDWHRSCGDWAAKGDCEKNSQFMTPMCKKSCKICKS